MIVLLANRWDPAADALARRWAGHAAGLLTPADLSTPGWTQHLADASAGTAVIAGRHIFQRDITSVLVLMPCIFEEELTSVVPEDRAYVAAEMTAFLFSWLTRLPCPVFNRPKPPCLSGPFWRPEPWTLLAAQSGIPVQQLRRRATPDQPTAAPDHSPTSNSTIVTVVGSQTVGEGHPALHRHARTLARNAGVDLLEVHFSSPEADALFLAAGLSPSFGNPSVVDAVLALLQADPQA